MVSLLPCFIDGAVTEQLGFKETLSMGALSCVHRKERHCTVTFGASLEEWERFRAWVTSSAVKGNDATVPLMVRGYQPTTAHDQSVFLCLQE